MPDFPLFQSDHSFSDESAFDTVGEADHQPSQLFLDDLVPSDLPDFPVLFQSDHGPEGAFDTVGAADHQSLLPLLDVDLLAGLAGALPIGPLGHISCFRRR